MQKELIREEHRKWLKEKLNITFEEVELLTEEKEDKFMRNLAEEEAEAVMVGNKEYIDFVCDVVDIICGPYHHDDE